MKTATLLAVFTLSLVLATLPLLHVAVGQPTVMPAAMAVSAAPAAPGPEPAGAAIPREPVIRQPSLELALPAAPQETATEAAPDAELVEATPAILLTPDAGAAGSEVVVEGAGFPADLSLGIYVGVPNAGYGPETYASAMTDDQGAFRVSFTLPAELPLSQPGLVVIASTEDGRIKAIAPFTCKVPLPSATI